MVLDCLSPAFPKPVRIAVLSFSSCLRALCGVCAGSAKASLSAHFAKRGNLGEVNAVSSCLALFLFLFTFLFVDVCLQTLFFGAFLASPSTPPPPPNSSWGHVHGCLEGFFRIPHIPTFALTISPFSPFPPTSRSAGERVWGLEMQRRDGFESGEGWGACRSCVGRVNLAEQRKTFRWSAVEQGGLMQLSYRKIQAKKPLYPCWACL